MLTMEVVSCPGCDYSLIVDFDDQAGVNLCECPGCKRVVRVEDFDGRESSIQMTLEELERLAHEASERVKVGKFSCWAHRDESELGPCSLTCVHNSSYVVAIAEAGPALLEVARRADVYMAAEDVHDSMCSDATHDAADALRAALAKVTVQK